MLDETTAKLKRAFVHRETLGLPTNAMRLVNGRGDGLPGLIVDRFNKHFAVYILDTRWHSQKAAITGALAGHFAVAYLVFKDRTVSETRSASQIAVEVAVAGDSQTVIEENGLRFQVDLNDHLNPGLFLDMRRNRKLVASDAAGRAVLNCFAYTCSFGVYCRKFGAARVTNVDISNKFLQKGKKNYRLNQLHEGRSEFVQDNTVRYLQRISKRNNLFDIIILDPPSFARFEGTTFSVKKDMPMLLDQAMRALAPAGQLFVSTNLSTISRAQLEQWVNAAAKKAGRQVTETTRLSQDIDFRASGSMKESSLAAILLKTA